MLVKEKAGERPVNTRGGAYPGCSLSWPDRESCSRAPPHPCLLSTLPPSPPPPPAQAVEDLQGSKVKGQEEQQAFLLSFSQESVCVCVRVHCVRTGERI